MSATRREREDFLVRMASLGVPVDVGRKVLRYAATLQRLAEAQCNGDWPADNGTKERKTVECSRCGSWWVPSSMVYAVGGPGGKGTSRNPAQRICKDCRTEDLVRAALAPYGLRPEFQGDPRGCVLSVVRESVSHDDFYSGRERGWGVPA